MSDLSEFVTVQEAATILGIHVQNVRKLRKKGILQAEQKGRFWLFDKEIILLYKYFCETKASHDPTKARKFLEEITSPDPE